MLEEQGRRIQVRAKERQSLRAGVAQTLPAGVASGVIDFLLPSGLDATFEKWLKRAKGVWEEELRWLDDWEQREHRENRRPRQARRDACWSGLARGLDVVDLAGSVRALEGRWLVGRSYVNGLCEWFSVVGMVFCCCVVL